MQASGLLGNISARCSFIQFKNLIDNYYFSQPTCPVAEIEVPFIIERQQTERIECYCFHTVHIADLIFFSAARGEISCINSYSTLAFIILKHQIKTESVFLISFHSFVLEFPAHMANLEVHIHHCEAFSWALTEYSNNSLHVDTMWPLLSVLNEKRAHLALLSWWGGAAVRQPNED